MHVYFEVQLYKLEVALENVVVIREWFDYYKVVVRSGYSSWYTEGKTKSGSSKECRWRHFALRLQKHIEDEQEEKSFSVVIYICCVCVEGGTRATFFIEKRKTIFLIQKNLLWIL